jgi:hypothetical protein
MRHGVAYVGKLGGHHKMVLHVSLLDTPKKEQRPQTTRSVPSLLTPRGDFFLPPDVCVCEVLLFCFCDREVFKSQIVTSACKEVLL